MQIVKKKVSVKELVDGFEDRGDDGVVAYGGALDVRPAYQREFIYKGEREAKVVESVLNKFPLNAMYWAERGDGKFEVLDGQQRTICLGRFRQAAFSLKVGEHRRTFDRLDESQQTAFERHPLIVFVCRGETREFMDWFELINVAGLKLHAQEVRNAVHHGHFVSELKRHFVRGQPGDILAPWMRKPRDRQGVVEGALEWVSGDATVDDYMQARADKPEAEAKAEAEEVRRFALDCTEWAEKVFGPFDPTMKGLDWGRLFRVHGSKGHAKGVFAERAEALRCSDEVSRPEGVYEYLLTDDRKHLNARFFDDRMRKAAYSRQKRKCAECGTSAPLGDMHADHIKPHSKGGATNAANCQMLCAECNLAKGAG